MMEGLMSLRKVLSVLLFVLLAMGGTRLLAQGEMAPAIVKVAYAEQQALAPVTRVAGTVVSRNDARLSAEVEGLLISVVDVGVRVVKGDALA